MAEEGTQPNPAGTPAPVAAPAPEPASSNVVTDFSDILGDGEAVEAPAVKPPAQPAPVPKAELAPAPQPIAQPAPAPQPAPVEAPKPAAAPVAQPPAQPTTEPGTKPATLEEIRASREDAINRIAAAYTISDEDATLLITDPGKVLPKMVGRLYMDVFDAVRNVVMSSLPAAIAYHSQARTVAQSSEEAFFKRWPMLQKPEFAGTIRRITDLYRQQNPQASLDQAIEEVGALSALSLKVPIGGQPAVAVPPGTAPTSPAPAPAPRQRPFVPANPGGAAPRVQSAAEENPFTKFVLEMEELDR